MNPDKIILPDFLIADLYKTSLVHFHPSFKVEQALLEENLSHENETTLSSNKIKFIGENLKNIVIIVNQPNSIPINKNDLTFLTNILKACQLDINDTAIVNVAEQKFTFNEIKEQLSALHVILFDVGPAFIQLPFTIPPFQIQTFADTAIMLSPSLSVLNRNDNESKLLKTKLWNSLKKMFNMI